MRLFTVNRCVRRIHGYYNTIHGPAYSTNGLHQIQCMAVKLSEEGQGLVVQQGKLAGRVVEFGTWDIPCRATATFLVFMLAL